MFVPLLLTLHVWQAPPLRPPRIEAPALAAVAPAPVLLDALLSQAPAPRLADPYTGTFSGTEVAMGSLGVLAGTVAAGVFGAGLALAACAATPNQGGDFPACLVAGTLGWLVGQLVFPPLLAAVFANILAEPPLAGSFARAVGYAFAAEGMGLAGSLVLGIVGSIVSSGAGGAVFLIAFGLAELVAVPLAASYGLHDGPGVEPETSPQLPAPLAPPQEAPPPSYTPPQAPPPPVSLPPPPPVVGFAFPF